MVVCEYSQLWIHVRLVLRRICFLFLLFAAGTKRLKIKAKRHRSGSSVGPEVTSCDIIGVLTKLDINVRGNHTNCFY